MWNERNVKWRNREMWNERNVKCGNVKCLN